MALLAGSIVLTSPLVSNLAYSFMTDVPWLAVSIVSGYFFLRSLKPAQVSPGFVALGNTASLVAYFIRQNGFVVTAAFVAAVFIGWVRRTQPSPPNNQTPASLRSDQSRSR